MWELEGDNFKTINKAFRQNNFFKRNVSTQISGPQVFWFLVSFPRGTR
jgi:hypothetical protein